MFIPVSWIHYRTGACGMGGREGTPRAAVESVLHMKTLLIPFAGLLIAFAAAPAPSRGAHQSRSHTVSRAETRLARTPPMGWNSWNHFRLNISDATIREQARAMVSSGMAAAGYKYVVIDGGWEGNHDANGVFHSDPRRFPDMKALYDYIH